ncbi:MAG: HPr(Ser) kinase/phosphatase [Candidatus Marinimicrobia bacterium]|nr:HPr(Ser) kinase/phosphatase [Candidatus Neomarinimicrobiota bacterium]MCF7830080.1 HPr(Ser) kinase/phosphatase [Candidatus Neomarinimicrobiota bacterium]MCF7882127.1 HPr(Ser) kinase/phosphatase [Candidatus Neomarinimicrobiota bacterium]
MSKKITLAEFLENQGETLSLTHLNGDVSLKREITTAQMNRPGLELVGYWDFFVPDRIQIFGNKEMAFLTTLPDEDVHNMISRFFRMNVPCVIFANSLEPADVVIDLAEEHNIPILQTTLSATDFMSQANEVLSSRFAPSTNIHGSMVDIYGIGVIFTGKSGIGKSEVALDLVERGHRLVADDLVKVRREASQVLIGSGHELLEHHVEVRGVGVIDVRRLFGIRSIRAQKRLEVVIELTEWDDDVNYQDLGIDDEFTDILGVEIPLIKLPIFPGKNITVISEVIALNQLLKLYGENPAKEFQAELMKKLEEQSNLREYLSRDFE